MTVTRANVEAGKAIVGPRLGAAYVFGGVWSPTDPRRGCDCSGAVGTELEVVTKGAAASWAHVVSTESWPYDYSRNAPAAPGTVGPYGTIAVARLSDIPSDAVMTINIMHGGGGEDSHMNCVLDGTVIESNGHSGTCTEGTGAYASTDSLWTDHWYLPGPIVEDGTPVTASPEPADTLFADVSEWQNPVDDAYPYRVISIRSNDGTHRDLDWANNYAWCCRAADDGRLTHFYVYFVWRPGVDAVGVLKSMVGAPHPKMVVEIDVESWEGQITGDQSAGLNAAFAQVAQWLGDPRRVVAYGNSGDLNSLWPARPAGMRVRLAAYGSNPSFPGKIAHQYTNGKGYGGGLPEGAPPFGNCDMNSADGITATALAALHGIDTAPPTPPGGISMADAQGITDLISGTNADNSPLVGPDGADYRRVDALADYEGPAGADGIGKYGAGGQTPEGPNTSRSLLDVGGTTPAKITTRRYTNKHGQKLDIFDLVVGIYQASGEPEVVKGPVTA